MGITLRPYQVKAVNEARAAIKAGRRRLILRAPTGAGKTIVAAAIVQSAIERGSRVLFLAHRKELIDQASTKMDAFDLDHGIIMAQHWRRRPHCLLQIASVQTLRRRELPTADLIIIDEAHLSLAKSYTDIIDAYPRAVVIGLTATPIRADGKPLGAVYHDIISVSSILELIDLGFLVLPRHFAPSMPDLSAVAMKGNDYDEAQLADATDKPDLIGDIVSHWKSLAYNRTTAVFAVNIQHSRHIVAQFSAANVRAEHVDGTTPMHERNAILSRFASGETTVVSNVGIFTEGYDNPRISAVVLARPTMSLALYLQMAGRGLRIDDRKRDCIILDHAGCAYSHGFVDEDREWSLEGKQKRAQKKREAPVRICEKCYAAYPAIARKCPECGHVPERELTTKEPEQAPGELVEMTEAHRAQLRRDRAREEAKAQTLQELQDLARVRGYSTGWAYHRWQARQRRHA